MADDKKKFPVAVDSGSGLFHKDHYKEVVYMLLPGLLLLSYLLNRFWLFYEGLDYSLGYSVWDRFMLSLKHVWAVWKPVAAVVSALGFLAALWSYREWKKIDKEEEKIYGHAPEDTFLDVTGGKNENEKWIKIMSHAESTNPAEWRLAIIDADIMLDELMRTLGYRGDGVGEMLKSVEPSDMLTLDKAWEAHKVRNRVAHSGADFELSERETKRVIGLFDDVFQEFQII